MLLEGSCHCGCVSFSVESPHPYPFNLCYCSICRKTAGGGGYAINLGAENDSLKVEGKDYITVRRANTDFLCRSEMVRANSDAVVLDERIPVAVVLEPVEQT